MTSRFHFGQKEGMCDECGLEATLKCSACSNAWTMCQKIAWKGHKGECKALKEAAAGAARPANGLAPISDARVNVIEADLRAWIKANGANATGPGSKHAGELIKAYGSNPDIAFSPPLVDKPFRQALLTLSRVLFIHTIQSLQPDAATQLSSRLRLIPPFTDSFPGFSGKEIGDPAGQDAATYEGLMRTMYSTIYALAPQSVRERWEALHEVGEILWDEQSAVERVLAQAKAHAAHEEEEDEDYDSDEEHGGHKCCGGHHD
ncbi:hypothetical protein RQP46_008244 [Phenoliferia psychrophenolica]